MKRREFLAGMGAAAWPRTARAQQAMPVVGLLRSSSRVDAPHLAVALRNGLNAAGYVEGQSVTIVELYADNVADQLPGLVGELVRRRVAVIVADNSAALAAQNITTIPIVFASGGDPVKNGLVSSLNKPGGSITGVVFLVGELGTKRFELLRQIVPKETAIAAFVHPGTPTTESERRDLQAAAQITGQQIIIYEINHGDEIESALASFTSRGIGALLVGAGPFMSSYAGSIIMLAERHRLPVMYPQREHVVAGGLMSYGTNITDAYRQVGVYAGRILKGEKPAELPVVQATKFEFVINMKTAKLLRLEFHPQLLGIADEVIE